MKFTPLICLVGVLALSYVSCQQANQQVNQQVKQQVKQQQVKQQQVKQQQVKQQQVKQQQVKQQAIRKLKPFAQTFSIFGRQATCQPRCQPGQICRDGLCLLVKPVQSCGVFGQCPPVESAQNCIGQCPPVKSAQVKSAQYCNHFVPLPCPFGLTCYQGECIDQCTSIGCEPNFKCQHGRCVLMVNCLMVECNATTTCINGICVDKCNSTTCPIGTTCFKGRCQPLLPK